MNMSDQQKRILIIEDEKHIAEGIKLNLDMKGYEVCIAYNGNEGVSLWKEWHPDLIVLDIMMPGLDGYQVLQTIRLDDEKLPVLILSAKSEVSDKIKGLTFGVDDYMTKPFNLEEFLLRIDRLIKRNDWIPKPLQSSLTETNEDQIVEFGNNSVDLNTATATCQLGIIQLTEQEIKLLKLFFINKGKPLARKDLLQIGWGYAKGATSRTVDNFMVRIRKYFEVNPKKPVFFKSRRSVGYIFTG